MALILDTNALSAAAEREPSALEVVARAERLAIPVIVLGEYRLGIAHVLALKNEPVDPRLQHSFLCS